MIGVLDCAVQAQNPSASLYPLVAYEKSSSSVRIRNVPKKIGSWNITSVVLAAQYPDNTTKAAQCVLVGGIWVGTIAGSEDVGEGVYTIYASGIDENGQPVNDYCLGSGQVTILAQEVRRDANAPVHMLYEEPTAEIREGDLFQSGETSSWMIFKDGQSVPIAEVDLTDYYQKSETSSASEISTALENIDLSDCIKYPVIDAQTNEWTLSIAPQGDGIEDEQKVVFCSYEQSVPGQYTTYMQLGDGAPIAVTRDAPASAATGYARLKVGTQTVPIFRDMPTKTSQLSNDSEFPTPDNPGRFLRYTAYPSHPDRWIVNFGSSSAGGISLVSDGENPISSYIDIAGRRITAGGEDQQAVNGRLASVGIVAAEATEFIAVDDRPLAFVDQLGDYYQKSETSSAAEISTAFENIDLSDYVEKASLSDYYQKSETSSASEISTAFENIDLSEYAKKSEISDAVHYVGTNKNAVTIGDRLSSAAIGEGSLAVGGLYSYGNFKNVAQGMDSAAFGTGVSAIGQDSLAGGFRSKTTGNATLAFGGANVAEENYAAAFGQETSATAQASFAAGFHSKAAGANAIALGSWSNAENPTQTTVGRNNTTHLYDAELDNKASATQFAVGVGDDNSTGRANGLEVMMNGDTYLKGLGGYDGATLSTAIPLQQMLGTQFVLSGEYEDDTTFEISVYGYTPPPPPPPKWFTMKNVGDEDGSFVMNNVGQFLEYSTDGGDTWSQYNQNTQITVAPEGEVKLRHLSSSGDFSPRNLNVQGSTGQWKASGNIMTLLDETGERTVLSDGYEFQNMFSDGSSNIVNIVDASELELPATTLASYCYDRMFYKCASLTAAPKLSATTLAYYCCREMFRNCTSLATPPELMATTLAEGCYFSMFQGCTSLTSAPALPATTLVRNCYYGMLAECSALTQAPELPATTLVSNCYSYMFMRDNNLTSIRTNQTSFTGCNNWFSSVTSQSGTFYCPAELGTNETIQRGNGYCPNNWTVVNI